MQYTLYSLLWKHGEVMSEKKSKNHFVGYIQNGNCHIYVPAICISAMLNPIISLMHTFAIYICIYMSAA